METILNQILGTILLRPYFATFLLAYFLACSLHLGVRQALLFAVCGYVIAWICEYSSIHNGIPFGCYYYTHQTVGRELWVLGVPFMDSMSFVFLSYASYSVALFAASPRGGAGDIPHREQRTMGQFFGVTLLGALFCMYLDIIIDPVALQGARWFLGRIYGYPKGGVYFGVPISNFIGWFLVGFFLISTLQLIDRLLSPKGMKDASRPRTRPWAYLLGPALYLGVIVFNLCVTFLIGDYTLLWAGIFIVLLPSALFVPLVRTMLRGIGRGKAESPAGGTYSI